MEKKKCLISVSCKKRERKRGKTSLCAYFIWSDVALKPRVFGLFFQLQFLRDSFALADLASFFSPLSLFCVLSKAGLGLLQGFWGEFWSVRPLERLAKMLYTSHRIPEVFLPLKKKFGCNVLCKLYCLDCLKGNISRNIADFSMILPAFDLSWVESVPYLKTASITNGDRATCDRTSK